MMKSIVCTEPGKLVSQSVDMPTRKKGEVLVKIKAIGICGTDIHAYGGNQPYFNYPRVLGHELSGTVVEGDENCDLKLGQSVYIIPYISCSECYACRIGKPNCCSNIEVIGVHRDGGMCEYISVPESAVVATDGLAFHEMALIECFAIGAHAVKRARVSSADTVLVLGQGQSELALFSLLR
ncbi:alcohol dehydrogenase catalytic domain-containing protein [Catenovulum sediminis]|uniref:alcohol dehydrogenase catalytic domain-containing protein n=1 Tax=Catenovulum sediminis TaxID=1740262 RepID=UPI001FE417C2|nr:alcohol dehydrogenase catalytic domain-containing protein [Catenovulum sediminis]